MAKKMTYRSSGVDIVKADAFIDSVKAAIKTTNRPGAVGTVGGFAACFRPSFKGMKDPLLVAATDGVGTKLLVGQACKKHNTVGIDLVAMSVNDLICCGAEPLFFLDYIVTGGLKLAQSRDVIKGIVKGCKQAGCALIGGETAEHPGHMPKGDYDMAGFAVGLVDRKKMVTGKTVRPGDVVLGLCSNGPHSNGFSLIRKLFSKRELSGAWGRKLIKPTLIYVKAVNALCKKGWPKSIANITGGGFQGNLLRGIPKKLDILIDTKAWRVPAIFSELQNRGNIDPEEMFRTFNMGIGMAVILHPRHARQAKALLARYKVKSAVIGVVSKGKGEVAFS